MDPKDAASELTCLECGKSFSTKWHLSVHHRSHSRSENDVFKCDFCDKKFTQKCHKTRHEKGHTKKVTCEECSAEFNSENDLKKHKSLIHAEIHKCQFCSKSFKNKFNKKRHELIHTQKVTLKCDQCDAEFTRKNILDKHTLLIHKQTFRCDQCPMEYTNDSKLQRHKTLNHRIFTCPECSVEVCGETAFKKHKTYQGYKCDICPKVCLTKHYWNKHMKYMHEKDSKVTCTTCHKSITGPQRFIIDHINECKVEPFRCTDCDKEFNSERGLNRHRSHIHTTTSVPVDEDRIPLWVTEDENPHLMELFTA